VIKEFILEVCKRQRVISCSKRVGCDKGVEGRIKTSNDEGD
jgi:hypothetical protein